MRNRRVASPMLAVLAIATLILTTAHAQAQKSGSIVAWGDNRSGQCDVPEPNSGFIAVAAGANHSLGVKNDGSVVGWGANDFGQCNVPGNNSGFVAVAAGLHHSLGLKTDGSIRAWGLNFYDQLDVPAPNSGFIAIAAGGNRSMGLKSDGSIVVWGQCPLGCPQPTPNTGFIAIAIAMSAPHYTLGVRNDGMIWVSSNLQPPSPNEDFIGVGAGGLHMLGLKNDGSIDAWGWNDFGQCNVPAPNISFIAVSGGEEHSLGLRSGGSIAAWGHNDFGQCNVPAPNSGFIAIAAGNAHSLGLKGDAALPCPSDINDDGVVNVDDMIAVILNWGPCPAPPETCPANIDNTGASAGQVDVDDLLAVILSWGSCP